MSAIAQPRNYRYYDFVMAAFVTVLICSNFIGAAKQTTIDLPLLGATTFSAGVLFFPISYIFGDILTEVYGYARARRAIWAGFGALLFASFMAWAMIALPASPAAVLAYLIDHAATLKVATLQRRLAAIREQHAAAGFALDSDVSVAVATSLICMPSK